MDSLKLRKKQNLAVVERREFVDMPWLNRNPCHLNMFSSQYIDIDDLDLGFFEEEV